MLIAGNMEEVEAHIKMHRQSMQDVLQLTEIPELGGDEDQVLHHMRINELVAWTCWETCAENHQGTSC